MLSHRDKSDAEIKDLIEQGTLEGVNPEQLAWTIADLALLNSVDKYSYSSFAKAAEREGKKRIGRKIDDVRVIVGHIAARNSRRLLFHLNCLMY